MGEWSGIAPLLTRNIEGRGLLLKYELENIVNFRIRLMDEESQFVHKSPLWDLVTSSYLLFRAS